jgi:hypothetical protein
MYVVFLCTTKQRMSKVHKTPQERCTELMIAWLHGAVLQKLTVPQLARNSPHFMEGGSSPLRSQHLATFSYPQSDPIHAYTTSILILSSHQCQGLPPLKKPACISPLPCKQHITTPLVILDKKHKQQWSTTVKIMNACL